MGKFKNGKAAGKDEIKGEMIKGGGDKLVDWILRMCNIIFKSSGVLEGWKSAVIVPLNEGKRKNYRIIEVY